MRFADLYRAVLAALGGQVIAPRSGRRAGATAVECAVMLPLVVLFVLGIIEFGRVMMVTQILTNGARDGARRAAVASATDADVRAAVDSYMRGSGLAGYTLTMTNLSTANPGDVIQVTVSIPYRDVTWLPGTSFGDLGSKTLTANAGMVKETNVDDLSSQPAPISTTSTSESGSGSILP